MRFRLLVVHRLQQHPVDRILLGDGNSLAQGLAGLGSGELLVGKGAHGAKVPASGGVECLEIAAARDMAGENQQQKERVDGDDHPQQLLQAGRHVVSVEHGMLLSTLRPTRKRGVW